VMLAGPLKPSEIRRKDHFTASSRQIRIADDGRRFWTVERAS
jgi:hypothetical protein